MGRPGKARKLDDAQNQVESNSGTNMQLGSGWKPLIMGFWKVEFCAVANDAADALARRARRHAEMCRCISVFGIQLMLTLEHESTILLS